MSRVEDLESTHEACFACGIGNRSGLNLHFLVNDEGVAEADWTPVEVFRSYPDRVHGGVLATLMDSAMVHALFARGVAGVTAEMTIRYLVPAELQHPLHITGRVDSSRRNLYLCSAEISQNGRTVVRAMAKFFLMPEIDSQRLAVADV